MLHLLSHDSHFCSFPSTNLLHIQTQRVRDVPVMMLTNNEHQAEPLILYYRPLSMSLHVQLCKNSVFFPFNGKFPLCFSIRLTQLTSEWKGRFSPCGPPGYPACWGIFWAWAGWDGYKPPVVGGGPGLEETIPGGGPRGPEWDRNWVL